MKRSYKIGGIISQNKNLKKAMNQAFEYCTIRGIKYGIVTNGYQYVIFEAFKRGVPWGKRKCIIFNGIEDIKSHFGFFFKYLNKESVYEGSLDTLFLDRASDLTYKRPLDAIINKDAKTPRNYLAQYLQPFIDFLFKDITDQIQIDVLRKCYVYDKACNENENGIRQFFYDIIPDSAKKDGVKFFSETEKSAGWFEDCIRFVRKNYNRGAVILLLGGVGSGKTTFIHRFFNIITEDELKDIWFYVDFSKAPTSEDKIEDFIFENIIKNFEDKYLQKFEGDFSKFGIELNNENKEKYVTRLCAVLTCFNYSLSLVLDNVDRCSIDLQENIIKESHHLADKLSIVVILALREESYFRSKLSGALDAYHSNKFHISSPKFEKLITNRIDYLLDLLNKNNSEISNILKKEINFGGKKEEIKIFFNVLKDSLQSNIYYLRRPITNFIRCISEGDMRAALGMFNNFLISGNTKIDEMMSVYQKAQEYTIAPYQFLKSVILAHSIYYRGDKSDILNVFDVNTELSDSHFLHLRILNYARKKSTNEPETGERGYININRLIREADDIFISEQAVRYSLKKLAMKRLIKFDNQSKDSLKNAIYFKITATGEYYISQLIRKFVYLDLIHPDTPISDSNVYLSLKRSIDETNLRNRFARTYKFIDYLKKKEEEEFNENPRYSISELTERRFMPWIEREIRKEDNKINEKQKNRY